MHSEPLKQPQVEQPKTHPLLTELPIYLYQVAADEAVLGTFARRIRTGLIQGVAAQVAVETA